MRFLMANDRDGAGGAEMEIDPEAEAYLLAHAWPGNVRELDNVINRARILAENNCITVADLPARPCWGRSTSGSSRGRRSPARAACASSCSAWSPTSFARVLGVTNGDRKVAAQRLGISLASLYRKLGDASTAS